MRTDAEHELFFGVLLTLCPSPFQKPLYRRSSALTWFTHYIENYKIRNHEVPQIIDGLLGISDGTSTSLAKDRNVEVLSLNNEIQLVFHRNIQQTIISLPKVNFSAMIQGLQNGICIFNDIQSQDITLDNGFYAYFCERKVDLKFLNRTLLLLLARSHRLKSDNTKVIACWKMLREDFISDDTVSIEYLTEMTNQMGVYLSLPEKPLYKPANPDVEYYESEPPRPFGGIWNKWETHYWFMDWHGNAHLTVESKTLNCPIQKIEPELEELMLRFYTIVEKETS